MKPTKLSLREMWKLYKVLKDGVGAQKDYLIDEIFDLLDKISKEDFLQALWLMYPKIEFAKHNPVEMATLFVAGLKRNEFFAFVDLVQGLHSDNPE